MAAPEHGSHARHRKPPLGPPRHQHGRDRGHQSLRSSHRRSPTPSAIQSPRPLRLRARPHLLCRPRRSLRLRLRACHHSCLRSEPPQPLCRKLKLICLAISNTPTPRSATKYAICGSIFDSARLRRELSVIEEKVADPTIWADASRSQPLMRERKRLETLLADDESLAQKLADIEAYFELAREREDAERELNADINAAITALSADVERLESRTLLSEETDPLNA